MGELKKVYISIGSNLGNRLQNLQDAVFLLANEVGNITSISKIYESASWGFEADDFLNACVILDTLLTPEVVLKRILAIEKKLGRERNFESGYVSRNIDIDILYYENEVIRMDSLMNVNLFFYL